MSNQIGPGASVRTRLAVLKCDIATSGESEQESICQMAFLHSTYFATYCVYTGSHLI